jgi:hypothetical protein
MDFRSNSTALPAGDSNVVPTGSEGFDELQDVGFAAAQI